MPTTTDGPASPLFAPVPLTGGVPTEQLRDAGLSDTLVANIDHAPSGECVGWGISFIVDDVVLACGGPVTTTWEAVTARWLVFMHTTDMAQQEHDSRGLITASRGRGRLGEAVADYVLLYADGGEERITIRRRHQIGMMQRQWGENCFQCVAHRKPHPIRTLSEQQRPGLTWGPSQTRAVNPDAPPWVNWLWAWENPRPDQAVVGLRIEPRNGALILSAVTAGDVETTPLRWEPRSKAILRLPEGRAFHPDLSTDGLLPQVQLDLGQVISATHRHTYPNEAWETTYGNLNPDHSPGELLVEYTAHPEACFHLEDGATVPLAELGRTGGPMISVTRADQRVKLRVVDGDGGKPVAVKLHVHGEASEYLTPVDRTRIVNAYWYEDWTVDYLNPPHHSCTYINGETTIDLPLGRVHVEISKGFEIAPIRRTVEVTRATEELTFTIERVLPWRERGWVTADTHVHFLSPLSAHLEGSGEGVNVVNLLASQWGELMTNVGDFDGRSTWGSRETGGDGEYLVRVGTENRQHVLGHISLLGYEGGIIAPMCSGGPDEAAIGDPIDVLLTEWARQCRKQNGLVIVPHFPNPRAEHAAAIISGQVDGVEMTSWGNLYGGIDPYSLSDWYRYLNCGAFVAAVGGTDKMSASTAVGAVRTYAKLLDGRELTYDAWKDAVRAGHTFATYGPLMEVTVDGHVPGARIDMGPGGGTVDVEWHVASVMMPMTRVEAVVNGEVRESRAVDPREGSGSFSLRLPECSWVALMIRGCYAGRPEVIAAHSSPVMVHVEGTQFHSAADALTILDQIEGALAYLDTVGTRADTAAYRRMRLELTSAYRDLHNRLHQAGHYHEHSVETDHAEHH